MKSTLTVPLLGRLVMENGRNIPRQDPPIALGDFVFDGSNSVKFVAATGSGFERWNCTLFGNTLGFNDIPGTLPEGVGLLFNFNRCQLSFTADGDWKNYELDAVSIERCCEVIRR